MRRLLRPRGATFVELMVLVGMVVVVAVGSWLVFSRAIGAGASCLADRILDRPGGTCATTAPVALNPGTSTPTSSALVADTSVLCAGGVCRGGNCFAAGTLVATPGGPRRIEQIDEGDVVLSRDVTTGEDRPAPVVARKATPARTTVRVELDDGAVIEATPEHPFWVVGDGWTAAGALRLGAELVAPAGTRAVRSLATAAETQTVYNLEIESTHTYYAGGVLVHNDCGALVAPTFGVRDLEEAKLSVSDRILVAYDWLKLPNAEREQLNRAIREERLRESKGRVGALLISHARATFPHGLPRELDTGVEAVDFKGSLLAAQARFDAHVKQAVDAHEKRVRAESAAPSMGTLDFGSRAAVPALFDGPRITEKNPMRALKNPVSGQWMIDGDTEVRLIADTILAESGVEERARFEKNDETFGRWAWRNLRDTGKAAVWRAGGAFVAPESLKAEESGEERFRKRLTQDAFDFAAGVEVTRTEAGAVVLKPIDTPASVTALRKLLEPANVTVLRGADGTIRREDFDALARNAQAPEELRKAAAHYTNPVVESTRLARPAALLDRFMELDAKDGAIDGRVTSEGMQNLLASKADGIVHQTAPSLHTILLRDGDGQKSTAVEIIDWSKTVGSIHDAELAWLSGKLTTAQLDQFYNVTVGSTAKRDAAEARSKLDADLERLTVHGLDGALSTDFEKDVGTVIKLGQLDGKYDQYVNRAWYEKLGVGTWGAVKEVLMVPVGLGELLVYVGDHGNVTVLLKGRPDGMPLLHVLAGQALANPLGTVDGLSRAFDEWWLAAQVEPDRATGSAVGAVATFFIAPEKLIKVARISGSIGRTLALAAEARAVGDVARAEELLGRARQMTRVLARTRDARGAAVTGGAAKEQEALERLVTASEDAVAAASGEPAKVVAALPPSDATKLARWPDFRSIFTLSPVKRAEARVRRNLAGTKYDELQVGGSAMFLITPVEASENPLERLAWAYKSKYKTTIAIAPGANAELGTRGFVESAHVAFSARQLAVLSDAFGMETRTAANGRKYLAVRLDATSAHELHHARTTARGSRPEVWHLRGYARNTVPGYTNYASLDEIPAWLMSAKRASSKANALEALEGAKAFAQSSDEIVRNVIGQLPGGPEAMVAIRTDPTVADRWLDTLLDGKLWNPAQADEFDRGLRLKAERGPGGPEPYAIVSGVDAADATPTLTLPLRSRRFAGLAVAERSRSVPLKKFYNPQLEDSKLLRLQAAQDLLVLHAYLADVLEATDKARASLKAKGFADPIVQKELSNLYDLARSGGNPSAKPLVKPASLVAPASAR